MASENPRGWEYKALRAEILQNQQNCLHIFLGSIAATGTIRGFAVPREDGYLSLIPLVVLIPGLYMWISQQESTFRIGAYIRMFIEDEHRELRYETAWAERRVLVKVKKGLLYTSSTPRVFHALGLSCFILSFSYWAGAFLVFGALFIVFLAHVVHSTISMNRAVDRKRHEEFWKPVVGVIVCGQGKESTTTRST